MSSVLIPLAPGFEEIEAVTLIDLFRRAAMTVVVAATLENPVRASRGVVVVADETLDEALLRQDFDLIALPGGGKGADNLANDERIVRLVQKQYQAGKWLGAICAAPKVLAKAGLLQGKKATSFPGALDGTMGIDWIDQPIVIDGKVVTSKGPGTAMDFALTLIELLEGKAKKLAVEGPLQRPHAPS